MTYADISESFHLFISLYIHKMSIIVDNIPHHSKIEYPGQVIKKGIRWK